MGIECRESLPGFFLLRTPGFPHQFGARSLNTLHILAVSGYAQAILLDDLPQPTWLKIVAFNLEIDHP